MCGNLEEQREIVMTRHKELVAKREALNREIDDNLRFFAGKTVLIKHPRGSFKAQVIRAYHDETVMVVNPESDKKSTRLLHHVICMHDED